jgi:hypothetical protein
MGLFRTLGGTWLLRRYPHVAIASMAYGFFKRRRLEKKRKEALSNYKHK